MLARKDTYISNALTRGANLTWLCEQTGVAESTLRKHYRRFVHSSPRDAMELAKIDPASFNRASRGKGGTGTERPSDEPMQPTL